VRAVGSGAAVRRAGLVLAVVAGASCGGSESGDPGTVVADGFEISDAWTRPTPPGRTEAAIYLTIENRDAAPDRFVGSASDRCLVMHPHLTTIDDGGVASMLTAEEDELALPTGRTLELVPNGLHVMCLGLADPLALGDTFDVELRFSEHEPVTVPVVVEQR
jgi:copper(I)-binding protein